MAGYREGGFVTERGFLSTTAATHCEYSGNVQYVIQSRRGKDISQIAEHGNEREVLFPPDTRFKVVSVERDARGLTTIRMDEV